MHVPVRLGREVGGAERTAARLDGDFVQPVVGASHESDDRVARFVDRDEASLGFTDDDARPYAAEKHFVARLLDVGVGDAVAFLLDRDDRRFVQQVGEVGARVPNGELRQALEVDIRVKRAARGMDTQDLGAIGDGWQRHFDHAVEAAGPSYRGVEHVLAVGRGHPDDAVVGLHAIHLDEELIERDFLFARPVRPATPAAKRVELVDEDDAGRLLAGALGQLAHAPGPDTDVHLVEVGSGGDDDRTSCLAGNGAGEQRLARSRRAHEQDAPRTTSAQRAITLGVGEVRNHVREIGAGFARAADVGECEVPRGRRCDEPRRRHRAALADDDINHNAEDDDETEDLDQKLDDARRGVIVDGDADALRAPLLQIHERNSARRDVRLHGHGPLSGYRARRNQRGDESGPTVVDVELFHIVRCERLGQLGERNRRDGRRRLVQQPIGDEGKNERRADGHYDGPWTGDARALTMLAAGHVGEAVPAAGPRIFFSRRGGHVASAKGSLA